MEKLVIIGSGPAAWTAAIYAARAELQPLLFEGAFTSENHTNGTLPLGQLALTTEVENFPGFPAGDLANYLDTAIAKERRRFMRQHSGHGVSGPELMELMRQQAINFGTRVITDDITSVEFGRRPFRLNALSGEMVGDEKNGVTGVRLKSTIDESTHEREATGMFLAIGHTPNTAFLGGQLELTSKKYVKWTVPFRTNTSVEGVFAAGDVADDYYRQAVTAAGSGCMAALDAERWLAHSEHRPRK